MSRAHEPFISSRLFRTYSNKLARLIGRALAESRS